MDVPELDADLEAVLACNAAFYDAFEQRDLDAMSDVWAHGDHVACVHPGWAPLTGWAQVAAAWFALFGGPQHLQFILTDVRARVRGDAAWVTCAENLLDAAGTQTVATTNVFERTGDGWRMVLHHGSPVIERTG